MKINLPPHPSPEQLVILQRPLRPVEIIKGAAGSGKTLTALYKLIFAASYMGVNRRELNIKVLSYNKTLKGYIEAMMQNQNFKGFPIGLHLNISVDIFAKWAMDICNMYHFNGCTAYEYLLQKGEQLPLYSTYSHDFLSEEMEYILKRFPHTNLNEYLSVRRNGRGAHPPLDVQNRKIILDEYIENYKNWKATRCLLDWEDIAWNANVCSKKVYDIIVVDEGQDFTANQYRTVVNSLVDESCLICVIDTAQKIYLNGFTWAECGIDARTYTPNTLQVNFRNTKQISILAAKMLEGVDIGDDGVVPQYHNSTHTGEIPILLVGKFSKQMDYIVEKIRLYDSLEESCAILLKSDNWTNEVRSRLLQEGIDYYSITRDDMWPEENINLVISTMHSAKGLEFDHVFMPGINNVLFANYSESDQEYEQQDRRLLAMAIGRGRKTVTLGEKPTEESKYFTDIDNSILQRVAV